MMILLLLLAGSIHAGGWTATVKASLPLRAPGAVGIVATRLSHPDFPETWLAKVGESLAASGSSPEQFARLPQPQREALVAAVLRGEDAAIRAKAAPALQAYRREENDPDALLPLVDDVSHAVHSPFFGGTEEERRFVKTAYDAMKHTVLKSRWTGAYAEAETMASYLGGRSGGASVDDDPETGGGLVAWRAGLGALRRIGEFAAKDAANSEYEKLPANPYLEAALAIEEDLKHAKFEGDEAAYWVRKFLDMVNEYGKTVYGDDLMPDADRNARIALAKQAVAWFGEAGLKLPPAAAPAASEPMVRENGAPVTPEALAEDVIARIQTVISDMSAVPADDDPAEGDKRREQWKELKTAFERAFEGDREQSGRDLHLELIRMAARYRAAMLETDRIDGPHFLNRAGRLRWLLHNLEALRQFQGPPAEEGVFKRRMFSADGGFMLLVYDLGFYLEERGGRGLSDEGLAAHRYWQDLSERSPRSHWEALLDKVRPVVERLYAAGIDDGHAEFAASGAQLLLDLEALRDLAPARADSYAARLYDLAAAQAVNAYSLGMPPVETAAQVARIRSGLLTSFLARQEAANASFGPRSPSAFIMRVFAQAYLLAFDAMAPAPQRLKSIPGGADGLGRDLKAFLDTLEEGGGGLQTPRVLRLLSDLAFRLVRAVYHEGPSDELWRYRQNGEELLKNLRMLRRLAQRR